MRFWSAGAVAPLAFAALAGAACSSSNASAERAESAAAPTVAVARVRRGDIAQSLTIPAEFRPFQEIEVHAKVAGYLKSISVDVGDRVTSGQLLAVLEIPELQEEIKQDAASVNRANEEVKRSQADLQRAESAHDVAHLSSTRLAGVMKVRPNLVAQQDIDEATGRDRVAEAQVSTAQAALAAAKEQLEIAKAAQGKTQAMFDYSRITAPFTGVITHRYADTGAMIQAGTASQTQAMPIVQLSQNDKLRLVIPVPESAVPRIHVGNDVAVAVQSLHKTVTGKVARFADRLDTDTRTMHVEVDVPNPRLELVPGMYADATLVLDAAKDAVVAPIQAIDRTEGGARVLVVSGDGRSPGKIEERKVSLGLETDDRIEVTRGVNAGDLVVVGSRAQLKSGAMVSPKLLAATEGEK
ncbi:MAG TPA: efflux RND transporter periplasmic adaptor subunit [Vicinamibacterales bacterium]|nr:efflux RND transporter periplasmic adaptor subunit [Vicinamibacterales bacterium]